MRRRISSCMALVVLGVLLAVAPSALAAQIFKYDSGAPLHEWDNGFAAQKLFEKQSLSDLTLVGRVGGVAVTIKCGYAELGTRVDDNRAAANKTDILWAMFTSCATTAQPPVPVTLSASTVIPWEMVWTASNKFALRNMDVTAFIETNPVTSCRWRSPSEGDLLGDWVNGTPSELVFSGDNVQISGHCTDPGSVTLPYRVITRSGPAGAAVNLN